LKILQTSLALILGLVAFGTLNLLVGRLFGSARIDLTEDALYTLSEGAREIARDLEEPVDLEFYFSSELGELNPGFRALAERVEEVLAEFVRASEGQLRLERVDPEPYSEAEEQAVASGVRGIPISAAGDRGYFGLVGRNAFGDDEVLPFFNPGDPSTERFLEYSIGRMLVTLDQVERPKVALLTSLEVMGSMPGMPGQRPTPPWLVVRLLQQLFDVETLDPTSFTEVPEDTDALIVLHPKQLGDAALYAIDQYALAGGPVLAFVDPWCEVEPSPEQPPMMMMPPPSDKSSDLARLFEAWGVRLVPRKVAADETFAMRMAGRGGQPADYSIIPAFDETCFDGEDPITANLTRLIFAFPGALEPLDEASTEVTPLIRTSERGSRIDVSRVSTNLDPQAIAQDYIPEGEQWIAARIGGRASSAFPDGPPAPEAPAPDSSDEGEPVPPAPSGEDHLTESIADLRCLVMADVDFLSELWWTDPRLAGMGMYSPTADNGDFVLNAVELLSGDSNLASLRARGRYERPFKRVQELRRLAEAKFADKEQQLEIELADARNRLNELQLERSDSQSLILNDEQRAEVERFRDREVEISRELRAVRLELNKDIEDLGTRLKLANVVGVPAAVALAAFVILGAGRRRRRD
jgi:ABC-type uncharacterized transport system involved in gliding motility auxiliary subunit